MKISRALVQRKRISASRSWTCLPGRLPRTSSSRSIIESRSTSCWSAIVLCFLAYGSGSQIPWRGDDCAWQGNNQISPMRKMELQQRGRWRNFVTHRDYGLLMGTQMMHFEWGGLQLKRRREKTASQLFASTRIDRRNERIKEDKSASRMPTNKALLNKKAKCYGRRGKAEKIWLTMNDMVVEVEGRRGRSSQGRLSLAGVLGCSG